MRTPVPTAEQLLAGVDDEAFRAAVDVDLRRKAPHGVADALRSAGLRRRWLSTMIAMQRKVEGSLAGRREEFMSYVADYERRLADLEQGRQRARGRARTALNRSIHELKGERQRHEAKYREARAGAIRFKTGLEEWIIEARRLCYGDDVDGLIAQIERHREATLANGGPSDADRELWEAVL